MARGKVCRWGCARAFVRRRRSSTGYDRRHVGKNLQTLDRLTAWTRQPMQQSAESGYAVAEPINVARGGDLATANIMQGLQSTPHPRLIDDTPRRARVRQCRHYH